MADNTSVCDGDTVQFTDTSTNIPTVWEWTFEGGTPATSSLQNPQVVYDAPGTYDVTLKTVNQFGSDTKILTDFITVNAIPTVASVTPSARCDAGTVTLGAIANAGTLSWFGEETGGTALGTGESFITPSITETTTFYVEAENNGCTSARVPVVATVNETPTIISTTPGERCGPGSVQIKVQVSSGSVKWYSESTGGTSLSNNTTFNTPSIATTTTYYVEVSENGCTSSRTAVLATVNDLPSIVSTTDAFRCGAGSVTLLAESDFGTVNWYASLSSGAPIITGTTFTTPSLTNTTIYYVSANEGSCSSTRVAVTATINAVPTITSTTPASRCDSGTVTLMATASAGTISWFANATGGTALGTGGSFTTPSISTTTSYYVQSSNSGCTSSRVEVVATVNTTPSIVSTTPASRCGTGTVTLGATASAGTLSWYGTSTGGSVLGTGSSFTTPSINTTTTFYVQAKSSSCTSVRTAVIATVNDIPEITNTTPASRCGAGGVTLTATASAGTISWFANATGGTALGTGVSFTTPSITTTTSYYVEAATASCTSVRTEVVATINTVPTITSTTPSSRCDSGTVSLSATANAGTLCWYNVATGGSAIGTGENFTTPVITTTTIYYVEADNNGCVSSREAVTATVNNSPTITNTTPAERCGFGSVTLTATASAGTISWFANATGGTSLFTGSSFTTPDLSETTTYYVSSKAGSCTSDRVAVTATINAVPTITSTTPASRCDAGTVTLIATASAGTISWFANATGGTALGTGGSFTTPSISTTTSYYVQSSNAGCTSSRVEVVATVNDTPTIISVVPAERCGSGSVTLTATASAGTISWFANATGGTSLFTGSSFTTPDLSETTTYYVSSKAGSCTSDRVAVTATINAVPTITSTTPASRCDAGTVTLMATASAGTLSWFNSLAGGTALGTGNSFTTPSISETTSFYVESQNDGCISERVEVIATVNITDAPTGESSQTFCEGETVGMITVEGLSIVWYDAETNGNVVSNDTFIEDGTTYYASQTIEECESADRLAVTMTTGGCLGVSNNQALNVQVYPVPMDGILHIKANDILDSIDLYDVIGKHIITRKINSLTTSIDTSLLASGTYFVIIKVGSKIETRKVIKK